MTAPASKPRCPSCGHTSIGIEPYFTDGFYAFCRSCHACGPYVAKEDAIAQFTRPAHAVAEVERLRKALVDVRKSAFCATTEMVENFDFDNHDGVGERGTGEFICNACGSDPNEHDPSCIVLVIDAALQAARDTDSPKTNRRNSGTTEGK